MKRLNTLLTLIPILLLTIACIPKASPQEFPEYEQEFTWSIPAYAPVKINIQYVYTNNHSIYDISCLGTTSLYRHSGGPTNILFEAEDLDTYKYTLALLYANLTLQKLTVGVWSGTQQVQPVYQYSFYTIKTVIHITLQVTKEPVFPSAEETAKATIGLLEKAIVNQTMAYETTIQHLESLILLVSAIGGVSMIAAIASVIIAVSTKRRVR